MNIFMHIYTHIYMYIYVYVYMYIHTYIYTYIYIRTYLHIYICIYMYIFICTYSCLYTYVYMYIYLILECACRLDLRCTDFLEKFRVAPDYERWGAGVETQRNVRGEVWGWGRVPFNEPYAPSLSTILRRCVGLIKFLKMVLDPSPPTLIIYIYTYI